jgi:hypothetical protein
MQLFDELDDENFILFASRNYDNPQCTSIEEFYQDLKRIKYLKKLFRRYIENDELKERLILNHLVVIYNVFGIRAANKMMFFRMEDKYWPILKTFLVYLNFLREDELVEVPLDPDVISALRKL